MSKSYSNEDGAPVMPATFVSELGKCAGTHLLLSAPSATLLTQGIRRDSGTLASPASSQGAATKGLLPRMAEQPRTQLLLPEAHPTLPLVSWASSPAQDKPFFNPFFIQQLCDFLKYQSNKTSTTHPISGSYGFPFLLKSISDSFVQPTSSAEPGPVYRFNFILRHTLTHYTSAKAAIQPVSNFFPPPYFLHAVALARNALPNKISLLLIPQFQLKSLPQRAFPKSLS